MPDIDWNRLASDAEETPGAILSGWLAEADNIKCLVVIVEKKDVETGETLFTYEITGGHIHALGLTEAAATLMKQSIGE